MVDLSNLNLTGNPEAVDTSDYPVQEFKALPRGYYNLRLIDGQFEDADLGRTVPIRWEATKSGRLACTYDTEVAEGPFQGRKIRFQRANNSPRTNSKDPARRATSGMSDMLVALGHTGQLLTDADYANGLENCIGFVGRARVRYDGYCKDHTVSLDDKHFPPGSDTARCPEGDHTITARAEVDSWFLVTGKQPKEA